MKVKVKNYPQGGLVLRDEIEIQIQLCLKNYSGAEDLNSRKRTNETATPI